MIYFSRYEYLVIPVDNVLPFATAPTKLASCIVADLTVPPFPLVLELENTLCQIIFSRLKGGYIQLIRGLRLDSWAWAVVFCVHAAGKPSRNAAHRGSERHEPESTLCVS